MHDGKAEHERLLRRVRQGRSSYERLWVPAAVDSIIAELKRRGYRMPALDDSLANGLPGEYAERFRVFFF